MLKLRPSLLFMRLTLTCVILIVGVFTLAGQGDAIELYNPSFEGIPQCCNPPFGWRDCGFINETPPDVQPSGVFEVNRVPFDGRTYLGMVTRSNDTWERVAQKLNRSLPGNACYDFSIYLCRSAKYLSPTKNNPEKKEPYTDPVVLRIWGGDNYCNKKELLGETPLIENTFWKKYNFRFQPKSRHSYIILEAFYKTPTLFPYNGNVLIDNASSIQPVPCEEPELPAIEEVEILVNQPKVNEPPPVKEEIPSQILPNIPKEDKQAYQPAPTKEQPDTEKPFQPKILKELSRKDFKAGETIRIRNLYFKANDSIIDEDSHPALDEVYYFLVSNPDYIVELGGHTNSRPATAFCNRLSTARARVVAEYLNAKGIPWNRLRFKGYGKTKTIASDATAYGRQKNQRVEIKILSLTG